MLIELFWPKKMKKLVLKYRSEGTLNMNVVRKINEELTEIALQAFVLFACLSVLTVWKGINLSSLLLAIFLSIMLLLHVINSFKKVGVLVHLYNLGKTSCGQVIAKGNSINRIGLTTSFTLKYKFSDGLKTFEGKDSIENIASNSLEYYVEEPSIIYDASNPECNRIFLESRKSKYYLSND